MAEPCRVVKVGGSLFDYGDLPRALDNFLNTQAPARNILLAGGGDWAEALRAADRRFGLGEATAHWLCIDTMSVTARLLAALAPSYRLGSHIEEAASGSESLVFDPGPHWRDEEPRQLGEPLPQSWRVTSDSIAARLAEIVGAGELVLLKSSEAPAGSLEDLANAGYVDGYFPRAARSIQNVRFVNLRACVKPFPPASDRALPS
jgi:aspartokinase-like uncharacterized kinase